MKLKVTCLCHNEEHQLDINPASLLRSQRKTKPTQGKDGRFVGNKKDV